MWRHHTEKIIRAFFSNSSPTSKDFKKLVMALQKSGAIEHRKQFAENYSHEAKAALKVLPPSESIELLSELADLAVRGTFSKFSSSESVL